MNWRENKDEKVKIANRDKPFEWFCKELGQLGGEVGQGKLWKKLKKKRIETTFEQVALGTKL